MNENKEISTYKSIRIKQTTKTKVDKLLQEINKQEDGGKVTFDQLVNYFLSKIEKEDLKNLQLQSVTWVHEEKRLRKLYEKKKGNISEEKWKQMLCLGELRSFFNTHSRLPIDAA